MLVNPAPAAPSAIARPTAILSARRVRSVSVVLPCLNEEAGVGATVAEAFSGLQRAAVGGEVIVVDNGSTDGSAEAARSAGATVVQEPRRGYGAAHMAGIAAARCDVIVMADADQTYDLENLGRLLEPLTLGADMVIASRLASVAPGAMPFLHRRLGTPVITRILRAVTGTHLSDSQSGYRAFWREAVGALDLRAPGMEYASEMLLKAVRAGLDVREVPAHYRARVGESKLHTFGDGWRHLRMLLILSPHLTLLLPGFIGVVLGLILSGVSAIAPGGVEIGRLRWLPVFVGPLLLILGGHMVVLGAIATERSEFAPVSLRRRLSFLRSPGIVDRLLWRFAVLLTLGVATELVLFMLWTQDLSGPQLQGVAGVAQAAIVLGGGGIVSVLSAEFATDSLWRPLSRPHKESDDGASRAGSAS